MPVLKLTKYLPMDPFTRMRNVNNLYREYGKQILREQGPGVEAERNSKDVMSILSKSIHSPSQHSASRCRRQRSCSKGLTQSFYLVKANSSADAGTRLDDEELIAEMATLTIAAHDTTSATLSFALYELARHPDYQERMRQEIRAARAKVVARGGSDFTIEDLDLLTLSMNAIKASAIVFSDCIAVQEKGAS